MLSILDPLAVPGWNELLLSQHVHSLFHTSHWARVLQDTYGYRPLYFTGIENGTLRALIPVMEIDSMLTGKRGVSLPFSDHCELIVDPDRDRTGMLKELIHYGKQAGWRSIELTDGRVAPEDALSSTSYYEHTLDLRKGRRQIFSAFSENTRRNIKKAEESGLEVASGTSFDVLEDFYRLHCMTRRRHGLPPQPMKFFRNIHQHLILHDLGLVMLAKYRGNAIAAAIYLFFGGNAIFKYGASDMRYKTLRANSLLMWRAMEWLIQRGCRELSLGRTDLDDAGLRRFKNGWGSTESLLRYYRYELKKETFVQKRSQVFGFQKKLFRVMPSFLLRMTGSLLYRHIG